MVLTIVLIILTLVLITIALGVYIWWSRYGKKLFNLLSNFKNPGLGGSNIPNLGDLQQQMKTFQKMFGKMGKF